MPLEERRQDQTGTDLVSQLEELKGKLAIAEVGVENMPFSACMSSNSICAMIIVSGCFLSGRKAEDGTGKGVLSNRG